MREKIDILPLQRRDQDLLDPKRAKPENDEKRTGKKKPEGEKRTGTKKSKK